MEAAGKKGAAADAAPDVAGKAAGEFGGNSRSGRGDFTLRDIDIKVEPGQLAMVRGVFCQI